MKLQLEQAEIEKAVQEFVANQGIKVEGKSMSVKFSMTRGEAGLVADLNIEDAAAAIPVKTAPKARAGTVGSAIEKQADKAQTTASVNKLPSNAAEALAQANADAAAAKTKEGEQEQAANTEEGGEQQGQAETETAADTAPAEQKTTTSLFG